LSSAPLGVGGKKRTGKEKEKKEGTLKLSKQPVQAGEDEEERNEEIRG